ncbi:winged helix-turn-helix transcriptional regulator [Herbidospora galbida]|uniref:winged helix-turn-helix transcriptional regulator n=1 Tax=Herbidospora galbida TaxID=2575442 RepID=UPI001FE7B26C|nr:helix-turn-helix domain-containing protein [Herbidospora galbida]
MERGSGRVQRFGDVAVDLGDLPGADSLAREIFPDVADKWALLIIETLGERTLRFSELRDEVEGISHKMLTQNLRMLERNGLAVPAAQSGVDVPSARDQTIGSAC